MQFRITSMKDIRMYAMRVCVVLAFILAVCELDDLMMQPIWTVGWLIVCRLLFKLSIRYESQR